MKLNQTSSTYETSGDMEEQFFSIKDQGMIFDILRNKMYSNPILAICREISCNARDAHREVGKSSEPIVIQLPNGLEPYYKIRDFGPGISPERMYDVFIQYTASTKRNDNLQTGGFGLGAKTPFSYSDAFSIVTNVNGVKYNYGAAIDETRVGKLALLSSEPTTDPNGTEIIIPVKPNDFHTFAEWTESSTQHWDVKPIIKGYARGSFSWQEIKRTLESKTKSWVISISENGWQRNVYAIVDGIEYPLDLNALRKYADGKLIDSSRGNLYLYFGVGELTLSANREQVQLDKATQDKIRKRLEDVLKEIKETVSEKIDSFPNLWDANVYYRKELSQVFTNINFLGTLEWKGVPLHTATHAPTGCPTFKFTKGKYSRKFGTDPDKLSRSAGSDLSFEPNTLIFINDLPLKEPTPRHVKKAFEEDDKLVNVLVICPNDNITEDILNKKLHLDKMGARKLSSITKATARNYTAATSRLLVFKFDIHASAFRQVSYSVLEEDTNKKVICTLTRESYPSSRQVLLKSKKNLSLSSIRDLASKSSDYSFYGVDTTAPEDRVKEEFEDFQDIEEFIDEKVLSNKTINYVEMKFAAQHNYNLDERMLRHYPQLKGLIDDNKSYFMERLNLHKKIHDLSVTDIGLLHIYEAVHGEISNSELEQFVKDNPSYDLEKSDREFNIKYPLLGYINSYHYQQVLTHIAQYINMIDKI
jgi:hypothetical protein